MPDNKQAEEAASNILKMIKREAEKRHPYKPSLNKRGEEIVQRVGQNPHNWNEHLRKQMEFIEVATWAASLHSAELERVRKEMDEFTVKFLDWVGNGFVKNDSTDCWIEFMENGTRWEYTTEQLLQQFKNPHSND
jgi:hypothetical protein